MRSNRTRRREFVSILKSEGCLFDVCSNGEIDIVKNAGIAAGALPAYASRSSGTSDIRYALDFGIRLFVVDNEDELRKFIPYKDRIERARAHEHPEPELPGQPVA